MDPCKGLVLTALPLHCQGDATENDDIATFVQGSEVRRGGGQDFEVLYCRGHKDYEYFGLIFLIRLWSHVVNIAIVSYPELYLQMKFAFIQAKTCCVSPCLRSGNSAQQVWDVLLQVPLQGPEARHVYAMAWPPKCEESACDDIKVLVTLCLYMCIDIHMYVYAYAISI